MSTTDRSSFSLKKGVGLRPATPPTPPPALVREMIDPKLILPADLELEPAGQESAPPSAKSEALTTPVLTSVNTPVNIVVKTPLFQAVTETRLPVKPGGMRERRKKTTTVTFRFPLEMVDRLRNIADYNGVSQTAILLEALELHLPAFKQPPADWEAAR